MVYFSNFSSSVALQHMLYARMSPINPSKGHQTVCRCLFTSHLDQAPARAGFPEGLGPPNNALDMSDGSTEPLAHGRRAPRRRPAGTSTTRCTPPRRRRSPTPCRASPPRRPPPPSPPPAEARTAPLQATALRRYSGTTLHACQGWEASQSTRRACTALAHVAMLRAAAHLPARGSELRAPLQAAVHGRRIAAVPASMSGQGQRGSGGPEHGVREWTPFWDHLLNQPSSWCQRWKCALPAALHGRVSEGQGDLHPVGARGLLSGTIT